jgi:hypothetical protein
MKGECNATKTEKVTDNEDLKREQWFAEALRSRLPTNLNYDLDQREKPLNRKHQEELD